MAMNLGLQAHLMRRHLERVGVDPQAVDLEAFLDPTLSFHENQALLEQATGQRYTQKAEEEHWERLAYQAAEWHANGGQDPYAPPEEDDMPPPTLIAMPDTEPAVEAAPPAPAVAPNVRRALQSLPDLDGTLRLIAGYEEKPPNDFVATLGWTPSEIPVLQPHFRALKHHGLVRTVYESRSRTGWLLTDRAGTLQALQAPATTRGAAPPTLATLEAYRTVAASDPLRHLAPLVAPHLHGLEHAKRALLLCLASQDDGGNSRGRISVLFHGPPGTAKTQLLYWAAGVTACEVYSPRMTGPGLTVDMRTGEPGALPRAHQGPWRTICVDEVEKVGPSTLRQTLQALEEGVFTYTSANGTGTLEAAVRFIGAANEIDGLPPEFRDRMDFLVHVPLPDREAAKHIVAHITNGWMRTSGRPEQDFVAGYLAWARQHHPAFPDAERGRVIGLLQMFVDLSTSDAIRVRPLESVLRVAHALARLRHGDVTAATVLDAIRIQCPDLNNGKLAALRAYLAGTQG